MNSIAGLNVNQNANFGIGMGSFSGQLGMALGGNIKLSNNSSIKAAFAVANTNTSSSIGYIFGF